MNANASFFLEALLMQLAFTGAVVALVGRRYPRRLPAYRFVAPAAVPLLLLAFAGYAYVELARYQGVTIESAAVARLVLAYAVLWLVGVLFARLVIRLIGR